MAEISSTGDQMLQLLEILAFDGPMTTAEAAQKAGVNRTVAHRLLTTLHNRGYLSREGKTHTLGPILGQMAVLGDLGGILRHAQPVMRRLSEKTGESVVLHRIDGDEAVVVDQAVSDAQLVRVQHREGSRHPLHLGASGLALLAFQPRRFVDRVITAAADPDSLRERLAEVAELGYATSRNELQDGVIGAAVPLPESGGIVRFSLAVLMPETRAAKLPEALPLLLHAGRHWQAGAGTRAAGDA